MTCWLPVAWEWNQKAQNGSGSGDNKIRGRSYGEQRDVLCDMITILINLDIKDSNAQQSPETAEMAET